MSPPFPAGLWTTLAMALAALILAAAWLNARRLRRRNEELARLAQRRADALEMALKDAEAASAAKGEFLAVMSHELRTPIHAILGMTELLLASRLDREQRESAQTVQRAGRSLLGLLNDILDFSKIEAGKLALRSVPFDPRELVEDLADLHSVGAQEKGLELVLHWDAPEGRLVLGDPDRLRQVLMNLLGNAIKFTAHGHVRLRVEGPEPAAGRIRLRFAVEDTGPGIAREKQGRLFESFSQEDTSITRRYGGTGLGLAISKRLVEGMGGRVGFESELGKGSTFWAVLNLPLAPEGCDAPGPWTQTQFRVLVADGLEAGREAVGALLMRWGIPHGLAATGREILDALASAEAADRPFSLLLVDEKLAAGLGRTGLNSGPAGLHPGPAGLRTVQLCPMHQSRDAGALRRAGFSGILRKPVLAWELWELLERAGEGAEGWLYPEELPEEAPPPPPLTSLRVLLAEDNPLHQQVARRLLESLGARVETAKNGREALERATTESFDVVLMDGQMPDLDGLRAAQAIREKGFRIPILAMTAHALAGDQERFLEAGMDGFLPKPFGRAELAEALLNLLPQWRDRLPTRAARGSESGAYSMGAFIAGPIDRRALEDDESQSPGSVRELVALYCLHAPSRLLALRRTLQAGDLAAAGEAVHALAGSAACIRADGLAALGRRLEERTRLGDREGATALLQDLEGAYRAVWRELEHLAAGLETMP